jgi:hypothetical protein
MLPFDIVALLTGIVSWCEPVQYFPLLSTTLILEGLYHLFINNLANETYRRNGNYLSPQTDT